MSRTTKIEKEKLANSIEKLSEMESMLSRKDLSASFIDIESLFREINFIHANCLSYKESINSIYENINYIRSKLSYLLETLNETINSVSATEELTSEELMKLSNIYKETPASNCLSSLSREKSYLESIIRKIEGTKEITKIPAPTQPVEEDSEIDTLPIGIAIGATGVLGSIGAVAVNEIYGSESKKKSNTREVVLEDYNEEDDYDYGFGRKKITPVDTPYHAAREERESERYYGNQLEDLPYPTEEDK